MTTPTHDEALRDLGKLSANSEFAAEYRMAPYESLYREEVALAAYIAKVPALEAENAALIAKVERRGRALETLLARLREFREGQSVHTSGRLGMATVYADAVMQGDPAPFDAVMREWGDGFGGLVEWWRLEEARKPALDATGGAE